MGKYIYIEAKDMTREEEDIGYIRGWRTGGDVFFENGEFDEHDWTSRISADDLRKLLPEAQAVERVKWDKPDDWENEAITEFVDLYERLEAQGREPRLGMST